jgi:hypothetical protein
MTSTIQARHEQTNYPRIIPLRAAAPAAVLARIELVAS